MIMMKMLVNQNTT